MLRHRQINGTDTRYLKAGQVYDHGDIHSKYIDAIIEKVKETTVNKIKIKNIKEYRNVYYYKEF